MNRVILIGNGFDLAHGLPTRYADFMKWYWEQWPNRLRMSHERTESDGLCTLKIKSDQYTWGTFLMGLRHSRNSPKGLDLVNSLIEDTENFEVVQSALISRISESLREKNWVDIENEYYKLLTESIGQGSDCTPEALNIQLQQLINLLTKYLKTIEIKDFVCNDNITQIMLEPIKFEDIALSSINYFFDHCNFWANQDRYTLYKQLGVYDGYDDQSYATQNEVNDFLWHGVDRDTDGRLHIKDISKIPHQLIKPNNTMILSFNYTQVTDEYGKACGLFVNHIHGDLNNPNSMIFGYGDELDDDYKKLLKQTDMECLKNSKSIKYLESDKYRNLLQFIESAPYQVYIMGHSCGNSDRTLLNTLFEHKNCISIKPFYYQKVVGLDNYLEIVQNICRNFTDMKLMRDRVVNKTFCEPLPQIN